MPSPVPTGTPLTTTLVTVPPVTTTVAGRGDVFALGVPDAGGDTGGVKPPPWSSAVPFVAVVSVRRPGVSCTPHSSA